MSFFRAAWGEIASKYEAILSANVNPDYPVDRRTMFTRLRGWLQVNGYSQPLDLRSIASFSALPDNRRAGSSRSRPARAAVCGSSSTSPEPKKEMRSASASTGPARPTREGEPGELGDATPVRLILRPDLEDRINHELTKAYTGPEKRFPESVRETRERL